MNPAIQAAFWMIGAIVSFSAMAMAGRAAIHTHDTFEMMLYRSLIGIVIVLGIAAARGKLSDIQARKLPLHFTRNISHFAGQNLWLWALTVIPLAQVFALEFTQPLWVILLAPFLLGERITRTRALTAIVGFIGILIVTRPGTIPISWGIIAAALAALAFAGTSISTRRLTRTETTTSIMFFLTAMQAVFGLVCAGYDLDIALPTAQSLPFIAVLGLGGLLAHFCITKALRIAPATVVLPIDFARLPVIAFIGWYVYLEPFEPAVLIGAVIIFAANYFNIRTEARA